MLLFAELVVSARIGNSIEYYDFLIYGFGKRAGIWPLFWRQPIDCNVIFFLPVSAWLSPGMGIAILATGEIRLGVKLYVINYVRGWARSRFSSVACLLTPVSALAPALLVILRFSTGIYGWRRMGRRHVDGRGMAYAAGKHRGG